MFDTVLQQLDAIAVLVERGVQFVKTVMKYNGWAVLAGMSQELLHGGHRHALGSDEC